MTKILVLHGPNLNLLGTREPDIYGNETLAEINNRLLAKAKQNDHQVECFQSNAEHELIQKIHQAREDNVASIVINPAAFTHTSVALRDALSASEIPFIEIHLSNIYARESFRQNSMLSDIALGVISGLGSLGYLLALEAAVQTLKSK